jgi:hypothetical protein
MYSFFEVCVLLGGGILAIQIVLSLVGIDHAGALEIDIAEGLDLLGVRALAAGLAGYGLGGMVAMELGLSTALALGFAFVPALAAAAGTAWLTRRMVGLQRSGSLRLEDAVGQGGTVRIAIPASGLDAGRVQFELQGRTLEMKAVTPGDPIRTGAPVTIVGFVDSDTVEVVPTPSLREILE